MCQCVYVTPGMFSSFPPAFQVNWYRPNSSASPDGASNRRWMIRPSSWKKKRRRKGKSAKRGKRREPRGRNRIEAAKPGLRTKRKISPRMREKNRNGRRECERGFPSCDFFLCAYQLSPHSYHLTLQPYALTLRSHIALYLYREVFRCYSRLEIVL